MAGLIAGILLFFQLLVKEFGHDDFLDQREHTLGNPVDTQGSRHDKADVYTHQRHHVHHTLHGTGGSAVLGLALHGIDAHQQLEQACQNGNQNQADDRPLKGDGF